MESAEDEENDERSALCLAVNSSAAQARILVLGSADVMRNITEQYPDPDLGLRYCIKGDGEGTLGSRSHMAFL
jgi:hypothetical protein